MKYVSAALLGMALSTATSALEFELYAAKGLNDEPLVTYVYSDGSENDLTSGDGFGILLGADLVEFGTVALHAKGGYHWGGQFLNPDEFGNDLVHSNTYFPLYGNLRLRLTDNFRLSAGASYLLFPQFNMTVNGDKYITKLESDIGYNVEATFVTIKNSFGDDNYRESGISIRYSVNSLAYKTAELPDGTSVDLVPLGAANESVQSIAISLSGTF